MDNQMQGDALNGRGIGKLLSTIGKWWMGLIAFLLVSGLAFAAAVSLFRFVTGNPEWQGIVMAPLVFGLSLLIASPGFALFVVGRLLETRWK